MRWKAIYTFSCMLYIHKWIIVCTQSCLTLCGPMARLLCPWNFLDKNTGVGCHFLLQRIFPDQGGTLSILTLSRDPSWDPSWKTKTLLSLRKFQGFRSSSPGTWHIDQSNSLLCNLHPQPVVKSMPAAHELVIALPPGTLFILCSIQSSVW